MIVHIISKQNRTKRSSVNISVSEVRDELTFSDSDKEDAPESPILFQSVQNEKNFNGTIESNLIPKFNSVRDEFNFSADDNEDAPVSPISLPIECKMDSND